VIAGRRLDFVQRCVQVVKLDAGFVVLETHDGFMEVKNGMD
jgi:hypothetical protein